MPKRIVILITIVVAFILGILIFKYLTQPKIVHYHAGFQVYKDGKLQDFSSLQYMHLEPCNIKSNHPVNEQEEKAHLHDGIGDVVHVHRSNATWADLFVNIKYPIASQPFVAYVNDVKTVNLLALPIKPYDSVVIFIGKLPDIQKALTQKVTRQRILDIEKMSESCGGNQ